MYTSASSPRRMKCIRTYSCILKLLANFDPASLRFVKNYRLVCMANVCESVFIVKGADFQHLLLQCPTTPKAIQDFDGHRYGEQPSYSSAPEAKETPSLESANDQRDLGGKCRLYYTRLVEVDSSTTAEVSVSTSLLANVATPGNAEYEHCFESVFICPGRAKRAWSHCRTVPCCRCYLHKEPLHKTLLLACAMDVEDRELEIYSIRTE
ncbi:hypothetical protein DFJ77DRAFT_97225 [Powellomyces hirtus]|nr:hypothetical protein DFJ77DRAFT_97225 [Powellomyces hirtus]